MDSKIICGIFQKAFTEVTGKLTRISLRGKDDWMVLEYEDRVIIFVSGFLEAGIVCSFAPELFHAIVKAMYGGELPIEEERILYLKEYMNIVCGRAVSMLNNEIGIPSRLSIPYYREEAPKREEVWPEKIWLYYETDYGDMQVLIDYSTQ